MNRIAAAASFIFALLILAPSIRAQGHVDIKDVEVGDKVEVKNLNDWVPAEVIAVVNNVFIRAKYTDPRNGRGRERIFTERDVRFPTAAENKSPLAMDQYPEDARDWTSANGKFTLRATIAQITETSIRLKREDGKIVEVELAKLSEEDLKYLKDLKDNENPFGNVVGENKDAAMPKKNVASKSGPKSATTTKPDPNAEFILAEPTVVDAQPIRTLNIKPWLLGPFTFPQNSGMSKLGDITGASRTPKISQLRKNRKSNRVIFSLTGSFNEAPQLVTIDIETGKQVSNFKIPMSKVTIGDISPNGERAVTFSTEHAINRVDIWQITDTELQHEKGWQVPNGGGSFSQITEAVFLGNDKLTTGDRKKNLYVWEIENAKLLLEKEVAPFGPSALTSTPNSKHLVFAGDRKINVLDIETGEIIGVGGTTMMKPSIAISEDGKLAAIYANRIAIWNPQGEFLDEFTLPGTFLSAQSQWFDERILLLNSANRVFAIDTDNRVVLARYELTGNANFVDHRGLLWILQSRNMRGQFGTIQIDPLKYEKALPARGKDLLVFKPGQKVRLDINLPFDRDEIEKIRNHFTDQLKKLDIEVANRADIQIQMTVKRGKTKKISVHSFGFRRFGGLHGETATVTPATMKIEIIKDSKRVHANSMTLDIHGMIQGEGDETTQQSIDRITKPKPGFFLGQQLPKNLAEHPPAGAYAIIKMGLNGVESETFPFDLDPSREDF